MRKAYLKITEVIEEDIFMNNRTFQEMSDYIVDLMDAYPNHSDFKFVVEVGYESTEINVVASRLETESERDSRIKSQREEKDNKEKQRLSKIKKLKEQAKKLGLGVVEL